MTKKHYYLVFFLAGSFRVAKGHILERRTTTRQRANLPPYEEAWFEEVKAPESRMPREGWVNISDVFSTRSGAEAAADLATIQHSQCRPAGGTITVTPGSSS